LPLFLCGTCAPPSQRKRGRGVHTDVQIFLGRKGEGKKRGGDTLYSKGGARHKKKNDISESICAEKKREEEKLWSYWRIHVGRKRRRKHRRDLYFFPLGRGRSFHHASLTTPGGGGGGGGKVGDTVVDDHVLP